MRFVNGASSWLVLLMVLLAEAGAAPVWTKHANNWAVLVCTSRYWYVDCIYIGRCDFPLGIQIWNVVGMVESDNAKRLGRGLGFCVHFHYGRQGFVK